MNNKQGLWSEFSHQKFTRVRFKSTCWYFRTRNFESLYAAVSATFSYELIAVSGIIYISVISLLDFFWEDLRPPTFWEYSNQLSSYLGKAFIYCTDCAKLSFVFTLYCTGLNELRQKSKITDKFICGCLKFLR